MLTACPGRRSFQNARTLAQDGAAAALLALLKSEPGSAAQLVTPLCTALRNVAVNDDICKVRLKIVPGGLCVTLLSTAASCCHLGTLGSYFVDHPHGVSQSRSMI